MMKIQHYILLALTLCATVRVYADETIRYVKTTQDGGAYSHQGRSWADAYDNIQTAIDEVARLGGGSVYVAEGTYKPTMAFGNSGSTVQAYKSFQMKAGVKVYGGFKKDGSQATPEQREMVETSVGKFCKHQTILSGNLSDRETEFSYNKQRHRFTTAFYNNVYHVVTFATNGFTDGRANALGGTALLDGCVIKDGNASNNSTGDRDHSAYGAGIYLVKGGEVSHCEVYHCQATRSGGGVYLDGGGRLDYSYVHDCQATGIGVDHGFGGGVFVEDAGTVRHSSIVANVSRIGAGIALYNNRKMSNAPTPTMFAAATLVAGNTALSEAGGVYMRRGGVLNGMTIARNACLGNGTVYSGMVTGTAGGVMVRDMAWIYNSVLWGNSCPANDDIQLNTVLTETSSSVRPIIDYVALSKSETTDWSGMSRQHVIGLSDYNLHDEAVAAGAAIGADDRFARFEAPLAEAGVFTHNGAIDLATSGDRDSRNGINAYKWEPHTHSDLNGAGLQLREIVSDATNYTNAIVTVDIRERAFAPKSTIGAIVAEPAQKAYRMMTSIADPSEGEIPTFFVDPSYKFEDGPTNFGNRWGTPYPSLTPIVEYAKTEVLDKGVSTKVQILVKAGTVGTADHHKAAYMRQTSLHMYTGVRIYGGYDPTLEDDGTEGNYVPNISRRNPVDFPTIISGNITGDYSKAVYHVVRYDNAEHTVLDGVQVRGGNVSTSSSNVVGGTVGHDHGAGIHFEGGQGNLIRNCIIAGNTAPQGAALFVRPINDEGTAELRLENCVIHNNAVKTMGSDSDVAPADAGVIYVATGATLTLDHCDVTRNVGAGVYVCDGATVDVQNTMAFANTNQPYSTIRNLAEESYYRNLIAEDGANVTAANVLVGSHDTHTITGVSATLTYDPNDATYPWMVNPTSNSGVSPKGDVTFYGGKTDWMPRNMNPMVNALASTEGTDMAGAARTYGGGADIGAVENRKCETYLDGQPDDWAVIYVRDYRDAEGNIDLTAGGDGRSWATAINGNAVYQLVEEQPDQAIQSGKVAEAATANLSAKDYAGTVVDGVYTPNETYGENFAVKVANSGIDDFNGFYNPNNKADDGTEAGFFSQSPIEHNYRYTSGLQYAVNLARLLTIRNGAADPAVGKTPTEVWIGSGSYYDGKGYKMQDGINVYGGFNEEAIKAGTSPAKAERQPRTYETIIQVRDVSDVPTAPNYYRKAWADVQDMATDGQARNYDWFRVLTQPRNVDGIAPGTTTGGGSVSSPGTNPYWDGTTYNPLISTPEGIAEAKRQATFKYDTTWDGLVIQGGYFASQHGDEGGGGVIIRINGGVESCEIRYNLSRSIRGGGAMVRAGEIRACSIHDNYNARANGGGISVSRHGTVFNSVIYDNDSQDKGSQCYIDNGYFYNNTVATTGTKTIVQNTFFAYGDGDYARGSTFINNIVWPYSTSANNHYDSTKNITLNNSQLTIKNNCLPTNTGIGAPKSQNDNANGVYTYPNFVNPEAGNFALLPTSDCINAGMEVPYFLCTASASDPGFTGQNDMRPVYTDGTSINVAIGDAMESDITLPLTDIAYSDRIKDCVVDIGAYEFNGSYNIVPTEETVDGITNATYYVTQNGRASRAATDPSTAACMSKLQLVLDAAGRYKYANPNHQVTVKLAAIPEDAVRYYPCRTAAPNSANPRVWSIQVPRGVVLEGGYTERFVSNGDNGFTDSRNVTGNPTYLGAVYNVGSTQTRAYHVVTFTDRIYDPEGNPYLSDERDKVLANEASSNNGSIITTSDNSLLLLSTAGVTDRGVVDGCFITGGQANGEELATDNLNENRYGGGALVNNFGHIRNCIVEDNEAQYGGALALLPGALVSGTLIRDNMATLDGGAIYVFEDGKTVEFTDGNRLKVNSGKATDDTGMAHVYTSTLVDNEALNSGGGVWFNDNARFNSLAIWLNASPNQANVSGQTSPRHVEVNNDSKSSLQLYPFAYSAVQSARLSGINNIRLASENLRGTRFTSDADSKSNYFELSRLSILNHTGMPVSDYRTLMANDGLTATDFLNQDRMQGLDEYDLLSARTNMEIGALAGYINSKAVTKDNLLLRLFVVNAPDVNVVAANKLIESGDALYGQPGSSFAYPFQHLDDALRYIYRARLSVDGANDLPFEVMLSGGTYYPRRDMVRVIDENQEARNAAPSQSFVIPEGVHLFGSFHAPYTDSKFYGQYKRPAASIQNDYAKFHTTNTTDITPAGVVNPGGVLIDQASAESMVKARPIADLNSNSIYEPWEFLNQTYLSGDLLNSSERKAYHVLSVIADENIVGKLPTASQNASYNAFAPNGHKEMGQVVVIDGVNVTDGHAHHYDDYYIAGDTKGFQAFDYYHGGGLMVDGNWYANTGANTLTATASTPEYKHLDMHTPMGYRNIPVVVRNSVFSDHHAGMGGAISTNSDLYITDSNISHNIAESFTETVTYQSTKYEVTTPGNGGALYGTAQVTAVNTLFANNEAEKEKGFDEAGGEYYVLRQKNAGTHKTYGGSGGVFYGGFHSHFNFLNCDFVRNKANMYPAIFSLHSGAHNHADSGLFNQAVNTLFWGNEAIMATEGSSPSIRFSANLVTNRVSDSDTDPQLHLVADQDELDLTQNILWFCGYEQGRGHTPVNTEDHRKLPGYDVSKTVEENVQAAVASHKDGFTTMENSNILLDPSNAALTGPNFVNPSGKAGYDGYNETADWSPARINVLTDAGSGYLDQDKSNGLNFYKEDGEYVGSGVYYGYYTSHPVLRGLIDIAEHQYMIDGITHGDLLRIARDPSPTHYESHIDIGVYEYPHVSLHPVEGSEVDILWVSTKENLENGAPNGSSWEQPTSDLQRAIETLLCSRNGHKKEIRIMEGEYMPKYALDGAKVHSFYINTRLLNDFVELPLGDHESDSKDDYYAQSLTIKGGYSSELKEVHDPVTYPVTLHQTEGNADPVFYVADALQRYGKTGLGTDAEHLFGALSSTDATARTMPITLDGLNFYNENGCAIYYADQQGAANAIASGTPAYKAQAPAPVKAWMATDKNTVVGKEIVPAKLTISKCRIYDSGNTGADTDEYAKGSTAVYAGQYGGKVLIYNSLFDNNRVVPYRGYNTMFVNNTVARNTKEMQFLDGEDAQTEDINQHNGQGVGGGSGPMLAPSKFGVKADPSLLATGTAIYNSVFWRNNWTTPPVFNPNGSVATKGTYGVQYTAPAGTPFVNNAYTVDESRKGEIDTNQNRILSDQNDDLTDGPNFKDPDNATVADRQYGLNPGLILLNHADNALYYDNVADLSYDTYVTGDFHTINKELAYVDRQIGPYIDLGAYEFNERLQRVVYVDPTSETRGNAGDTWQYPMGKTELQRAINTAALYGATYGQAYVYVRGGETEEDIILRSGVNIYGSVNATEAAGGYLDAHRDIDENGFEIYYTDRTPHYMADSHLLYNYEAKVRRNRMGLMQNDNLTSVRSITVDRGYVPSIDTDHPVTAIIDGFEVKGATTMPAINLHADRTDAVVAARNMVVRDNIMDESREPLIKVGDALLYNVLVCSNTKAADMDKAVVNLSDKGYALNVSVNELQNNMEIAGTTANAIASLKYKDEAYNYYLLYSGDSPLGPGYGSQPDEYKSDKINQLSAVPAGFPAKYVSADDTYRYHDVVNYNVDKDLLGNPRKVDEKVDYGCYETYAVETGRTVVAEYHTEVLPQITLDNAEKMDEQLESSRTLRFENYPHKNSVIYLRDNAILVLDEHYGADNTLGQIGYECEPAHVVVSESANLYGQGNPIKAQFATLDKVVGANGKAGMVAGMPFDVHPYLTRIKPVAGGELTDNYYGDELTFKTYSGINRSAWKYKAQVSDGAWEKYESDMPIRNFLVEPKTEGGAFAKGDIISFTGLPTNTEPYAYTESVTDKTKKTVVLTQNDSHQLSGDKPEFTTKENMGWNLVGLPYLVSDYQPYERVTVDDEIVSAGGDYLYRMHIPHEMWLYYDGNTTLDGTQTANGAGYYPVNSWENTAASWHLDSGTPSIWMGEGIFMQTAALQTAEQKQNNEAATENVDFYLPVYQAPVSPSRQMARYYAGAVEEELTPLAPAFHTRKVTVRTGQLRVEVPTEVTAVEVIDAQGRVRATTDTTTSIQLPNGVYVLRAK